MILYFVIAVVVLLLIGYFIFKKPKLPDQIVSPQQESNYQNLLEQHVGFYQRLRPEEKQRFVLKLEAFLQETRIEGVGLELEDLDRVLIAAGAIIPIFNFKDWKYPQLTNIILYPDAFNNDFKFDGNGEMTGMVGNGFMNGQMILSRDALRKGFSASAGNENTAIHEFVHLLDKEDGATDGIPEHLLPHEYVEPWLKLIHQEIQKIEAGKSDINPYATTNEAEFFAVASEYFFGKPEKLKEKHPELYEMLNKIFRQEVQ